MDDPPSPAAASNTPQPDPVDTRVLQLRDDINSLEKETKAVLAEVKTIKKEREKEQGKLSRLVAQYGAKDKEVKAFEDKTQQLTAQFATTMAQKQAELAALLAKVAEVQGEVDKKAGSREEDTHTQKVEVYEKREKELRAEETLLKKKYDEENAVAEEQRTRRVEDMQSTLAKHSEAVAGAREARKAAKALASPGTPEAKKRKGTKKATQSQKESEEALVQAAVASAMKDAEARVASAKAELKGLKAEKKEREREIKALEAETEGLEERAEALETMKADLEKNRAEYAEALRKEKSLLHDLISKEASHETDAEQRKERLLRSIAEAKMRVAQLEEAVQQRTKEFETYTETVKEEVAAHVSTLEAKVFEAEMPEEVVGSDKSSLVDQFTEEVRGIRDQIKETKALIAASRKELKTKAAHLVLADPSAGHMIPVTPGKPEATKRARKESPEKKSPKRKRSARK